MESISGVSEERNSVVGKSDPPMDPEAEVEEILRKAGLEEDSEEEYLSAEEESGTEADLFQDNDTTDNHKHDACLRDEEEQLQSNVTPHDDDDGDNGKDSKKADELAARQKEEDLLTTEEKEERKDKGQTLKADGNTKFRNGDYEEAIEVYTEALETCPLSFHRERAIMFANRAACKMKKEQYEAAIEDSTSAIDLHPQYLKAILRRAELYEKTEKLDEALKDYEKVVELDPSQHAARAACIKLAEQIKERNEKLKGEMIGKLKDLGNLVLRPFGLNVNNFNLQQDPNTGSYSMQFRQNAAGNGS